MAFPGTLCLVTTLLIQCHRQWRFVAHVIDWKIPPIIMNICISDVHAVIGYIVAPLYSSVRSPLLCIGSKAVNQQRAGGVCISWAHWTSALYRWGHAATNR